MTFDKNPEKTTTGTQDDIRYPDKCIRKSGPMAGYGGGADDEENLPHQCVACLLAKTDIRYWRRALLEMMKSHFNHESLLQMLQFLLSNIDSALEAYERGRHSLLHVNYAQAPPHLDLVNWRRILVGVNLVLCEPDTNFEIRMIGISVGESTNYSALKGMRYLLQKLLELPWDVMQMVIHLNLSDASVLYETLTDTSQGYGIPPFCCGSIRTMYEDESKRNVLRKVGFYRRSAAENITWTRPERDMTKCLLLVLLGIYRSPSGVQTTTD